MQITINTDTDDLPAVIRMLQALAAGQDTRLVEKPAAQSYDGAALANFIARVNEPDYKTEGKELDYRVAPPEVLAAAQARKAAAQAVDSDHAADAMSYAEPSPEQVFPSLFDSHVPGDNITVREAREAHSDVTVDAAGLPWDARIHSGAKTKLTNGNWKLLRGVDPALVASVEAELRGDPKPPVAPPPPAPALATVTPAPVAPSAPPIPPAPATPKPITNAAELVAAVMDKRFTTDQVNAACQAVGVENVASLLAKQDKLPEVLRHLGVPA